MNRCTFEMLAKWIAKETGAKVLFDGQSTGASANVKTNEISMPCDLKEHNILAALALLMHEGGHLKYSKKIPNDIVTGMTSRNILNVMEDIRVDNHNFGVLYNIKEFYHRLIRDHVYEKKDEIAKEDLLTRCMINAILSQEGFRQLDDKEALKFSSENDVDNVIWEGQQALESSNWTKAKECIKKIKKIFKITDEQDPPMPKGMAVIGTGMSGKGSGDSDGKGGGEDGEGSDDKGLGDTGKFLRPSSAWDKGEGIKGPSREILGDVAFQDLTREAFKELLNIKEKRMIFEGPTLNVDRITDFFTGEIDELFQQEDKIKVKKSKIAFCIDSSGSMSSGLLDGKMRTDVLVRCVRSMIQILQELQATEGLNISYDVWAFDYNAQKLDPDKWEREYSARSGGTNLLTAFQTVQEDILKNQEIDGNKMVILMTDGEVSTTEIDELRNHIMKHGAEVRCLVMGVGAKLDGQFVKTIAGDANILAEEHADTIVMDCIRTLLD